ncbi:MAG: 50S ribosomal protein L24 [Spirochaetota bacterium]|nr:50S ribosomal protein L24 [Spirochaetota bacterium]
MKIKKNDEIIVVSGREKGRRGEVFYVSPSDKTLLVRGVNFVKKTVKKNKEHPNGTILEKEAPIHVSNVMLYCPKNDKGVRIEYVIDDKGNKRRKAKGVDHFFDN